MISLLQTFVNGVSWLAENFEGKLKSRKRNPSPRSRKKRGLYHQENFESFLPILLNDINKVNMYPKNSTCQIALAYILREHNDRYQQTPSLANG